MASVLSAGTTSNTALNLSADTTGILQLASNGSTTALTIDTSQNVGIGTASPSQKLHVSVSSGNVYTQISSGSNNIYYGWNNANSAASIESPSAITFLSGGSYTERMRITSGGVLVINSSAPETTISGGTPIFQVTGSGFNSIGAFTRRQNDANGAALCLVKSRNTSANSYTAVQNGDTLGSIIFIGDDGTDLDTYGAFIQAQVDGTPGANDMPGRLVFATTADGAASPTERMRIDSSGNVCVGTATALATAANRGNVTINGSSGSIVAMGVGGSTKGYLFQDSSTMYLVNAGTGSTNFEVNGSERMRIDSNGNLCLGINGQMNSGKQSIEFSGFTQNGITLRTTYASLGSAYLAFYNSANQTAGTITQNGTTTVAYNTSSDYRLKENIQPMVDALAKIAQLKPVTYKWKSDGSDGQGFIAHELQAVVPDCVTGEKDAIDAEGNPKYQGVDTSFLVATLTAAIQELKAELDATKAEVAALKGVN